MFNSYFICLGNLLIMTDLVHLKKKNFIYLEKNISHNTYFFNEKYSLPLNSKLNSFTFFQKSQYSLKPIRSFYFGQGLLLKKNNRSCI